MEFFFFFAKTKPYGIVISKSILLFLFIAYNYRLEIFKDNKIKEIY